MPCYTVNQHSIQILLSWIQAGQIAIPEIQRPFVWSGSQVRDLIDSLYRGYPVGYLIAWQSPNVRLRSGENSSGRQILIDGQQRVTALMAAVLGHRIINNHYQKIRVRIAFHPLDEKFEVTNPAIEKNSAWLPDITSVLADGSRVFDLANQYLSKNPETDQAEVFERIQRLRNILNNQIGFISLNSDLDIEEVTEIFIRINAKGKVLSQADFIMSKIAANESYGGHDLRKLIDYFCHLCTLPEDFDAIQTQDIDFANTSLFQKLSWLKDTKDDLYNPEYTDVLRVAFVSEFGRGRLRDLVALLSGRDFEKRTYEEVIAEDSFAKLQKSVLSVVSQTHFQRFLMILRSAGIIDPALIGSVNVVNYAYVVYLLLKKDNFPPEQIESYVRRSYVLNILAERFAGNPEGTFDFDIRRINSEGFGTYFQGLEDSLLSMTFWGIALPQKLRTSSASSPFFRLFRAAQVKANDKGFLSKAITVRDMILHRGDRHHIYPKQHLIRLGYRQSEYNQIANYALTQSEINIQISDTAPEVYFAELVNQCSGGSQTYGAVIDRAELESNLEENCIPTYMLDKDKVPNYETFLSDRRHLMAQKIKCYYEGL
ncbi:MAG: DUF262 domain-containing protein [Cyanobacteria bacterium J06614_10]